jgi:L-iditol 2-dehydrogenase
VTAPPTTMMALRKHAAGEHTLHLDEVPAPQARPGWVVLDVGYAGICGTDLHIVEDEFPSWPPVTLGHEFMGTVRELGEGVEDWSVGDRVVCEPHSLACTRCHLCRRGLAHLCAHKRSPGWGIDGGFAERVAVPAHLLHAVPDNVDDVAAGLVEPLAIVVTAFERTPVPPGGTVMVIGPGPIGILCALTAAAAGAGRVVLVGRRSSAVRLELAAELGLEVWDSAEGDVAERAYRHTQDRGIDLVVETSGAAAAVAQGLGSLRRRGQMCVLGVSGEPAIPIPWGLAMNRAADVAFSLSSSWSSWDAALALLARGAVDPRPLATVFPLTDWAQAFAATRDRGVVKALLRPVPHSTTRSTP